MSQKSKTRKSVRFSETPLIRQYSKDYSEDRKANSQTKEEKHLAILLSSAENKSDKLAKQLAKEDAKVSKLARQLAKEEDERRTTRLEDSIQITRSPTKIFSVKKTEPKTKKGAWHKLKKMFGVSKSSKGGKKRTRKNRTTRKNRYY